MRFVVSCFLKLVDKTFKICFNLRLSVRSLSELLKMTQCLLKNRNFLTFEPLLVLLVFIGIYWNLIIGIGIGIGIIGI